MRIYIVGYMGAGKSTAAKRLAHRLGVECYDTDRMFEARYHISVNDFFHKYDETLYRKLETQILQSTEQYENAVIATGGGTACFNGNIEWMNQHGLTVFLKVSPMTSYNRLLQSKVKRPLAVDRTPEELLDFINKNYTERMSYYEKAQMVVKGEDLDLDVLVEAIQKLNPQASAPEG